MKMINCIVLIVALSYGCSQNNKDSSEETSTNSSNDTVTNRDSSYSSGLSFFEVDRMIADVDKNLDKYKRVDSFFAPSTHLKDSLKTSMYFLDGKPLRLSYTVFDDGGMANGDAYFYFDKDGYAFAHKLIFGERDIVEIYLGSHKVMRYFKNAGKITIQKSDSLSGFYREAFATKTLDDLMQLYSTVAYTAPKPSKNANPILITNKNVKLFKEPSLNSETLANIPAQQPLVYLGTNHKQETIMNNTWLWYNVLTSDKNIGWIFGSPEFVGDYNDENAE